MTPDHPRPDHPSPDHPDPGRPPLPLRLLLVAEGLLLGLPLLWIAGGLAVTLGAYALAGLVVSLAGLLGGAGREVPGEAAGFVLFAVRAALVVAASAATLFLLWRLLAGAVAYHRGRITSPATRRRIDLALLLLALPAAASTALLLRWIAGTP